MSAAAIPPLNALCNCSAVVLKSKPVAAAISPVIFNTSLSSSAPSTTVNKFGAALAICCSSKGTVPANLVKVSNALEPSSADPVKNFNCIDKFSTSTAVLRKSLPNLKAPIAATAPTITFCKLPKALALRFVFFSTRLRFFCTSPNALLVLLTPSRIICSFMLIPFCFLVVFVSADL